MMENRPSLFSLINDLLAKSGSSIVQEKNIVKLKKEASLIEKKVAELTIENALLLSRINALNIKSQNTIPFKNINQGNRAIYQHLGQELPDYFPLNERELKILVSISMKEEISLREISKSVNILEQIVGFYLKELEAQEMVIHKSDPPQYDLWSLSPKGSKFLADNELIT